MKIPFRPGDTALITGASSGIGEMYARKLGAMGLNLVLIARRIDLLEQLKSEIEQQYSVTVDVFGADLSVDSWSERIPGIEKLEVDLLINNAGTGYPDEFGSHDFETDRKLIQLNCITPLELTHLVLPGMKQRKRGGIIFVSSLMGMQGVPYMTQYSATKGYLLNLGESLYTECKKYNVAIQVLLPGATKTSGADLYDIDYEQLPIKWMNPDNVVDVSLSSLGKQALVIPGKLNRLAAGISSYICTRSHLQKIMNLFAKKVIRKASEL